MFVGLALSDFGTHSPWVITERSLNAFPSQTCLLRRMHFLFEHVCFTECPSFLHQKSVRGREGMRWQNKICMALQRSKMPPTHTHTQMLVGCPKKKFVYNKSKTVNSLWWMAKQHATTLRSKAYLMGRLVNVIWGDDWDLKYFVDNSTKMSFGKPIHDMYGPNPDTYIMRTLMGPPWCEYKDKNQKPCWIVMKNVKFFTYVFFFTF